LSTNHLKKTATRPPLTSRKRTIEVMEIAGDGGGGGGGRNGRFVFVFVLIDHPLDVSLSSRDHASYKFVDVTKPSRAAGDRSTVVIFECFPLLVTGTKRLRSERGHSNRLRSVYHRRSRRHSVWRFSVSLRNSRSVCSS